MSIPIIGQPKISEDWFVTVPITCTCGSHFLLIGQEGAVRPCPGCMKLYKLVKLPYTTPDGQVVWPIGTMDPSKVPQPDLS